MGKVGNITFHELTFSDAIKNLSEIIEHSDRCHQVVVANVFSVVLAKKDKEFREICQKADVVFADGFPVVFFSRFLGNPIPQRIAGPDFMWHYSSECAKKGFKAFLLGGEEPFLSNLKQNLENNFPGFQIVGKYSPPFGTWSDQETAKMVDLINNSGADILWLGVSTPKQDKWIYSVKNKLHTKVAIAVGAAFDFHSGRVKRAPRWVQTIGMEWFHRFLQDPKRLWKRYLIGNMQFFWIVSIQLMRKIFSKA
jgi:N-acetylglucosaminyldiphosphoundecaprenol N-acetyl-beta-D-mannosaminyltransferase